MDAHSAERLRRVIILLARHLNASATAADLTPTQASVLGFIDRWGPIGLSEIVASEGVNPTMLSRILAALETKGLVTREPGANDLRSVTVRATRSGHRLQDRIRGERAAAVAGLVDQLPPSSRDLLAEALEALEGLADVARQTTAR
jgi:DNA-binding MarR family transcriptional regulator